MMPSKMKEMRDFADTTAEGIITDCQDALEKPDDLSKRILTDLGKLRVMMQTMRPGKIKTEEEMDTHKDAILDLVGEEKGLGALTERMKDALNLVKDDLKSAAERDRRKSEEAKKEKREADPALLLKKEQGLALRNKVPICLIRESNVIGNSQQGALEPYVYKLSEEGKGLLEKGKLHTWCQQFPGKGSKRGEFETDGMISARLVPPAIEFAEMDTLLEVAEDLFPNGVNAAKRTMKVPAGKSLAGKHCMHLAAEGGHFNMAFASAPLLYTVLPGGGDKALSMLPADKAPLPSEGSKSSGPHSRKSLESALVTAPDASWCKLVAYEGVFIPAGFFYKDVTLGQTTNVLKLYGVPAEEECEQTCTRLRMIAEVCASTEETTVLTQLKDICQKPEEEEKAA
jgi:hypothetical protein